MTAARRLRCPPAGRATPGRAAPWALHSLNYAKPRMPRLAASDPGESERGGARGRPGPRAARGQCRRHPRRVGGSTTVTATAAAPGRASESRCRVNLKLGLRRALEEHAISGPRVAFSRSCGPRAPTYRRPPDAPRLLLLPWQARLLRIERASTRDLPLAWMLRLLALVLLLCAFRMLALGPELSSVFGLKQNRAPPFCLSGTRH